MCACVCVSECVFVYLCAQACVCVHVFVCAASCIMHDWFTKMCIVHTNSHISESSFELFNCSWSLYAILHKFTVTQGSLVDQLFSSIVS